MGLLENASVAYLDTGEDMLGLLKGKLPKIGQIYAFDNPFSLYDYVINQEVDIVISSRKLNSASGIALMNTIRKFKPDLVFIFFFKKLDYRIRRIAYQSKVSDIFDISTSSDDMVTRVEYLLNKSKQNQQFSKPGNTGKISIPLYKRVFDVLFAGTLLLLLSPFFLLIALLIKLESAGPVIYYSSRVGTGYRVFKFYKFRSMRLNADEQLKSMKHLNQYDKTTEKQSSFTNRCDYCLQHELECKSSLYADGQLYCENLYKHIAAEEGQSTFVKIKNDPRITRIGRIIRNTSIDELPQLYNVLIGDMSIVGNRPLPLYEAEKLTTDQFSERFHAPAGITGLWQISKRGKGKMTEEERIELDNQYARDFSLWLDIRILFKTFSALVQKENV